MRIYVIGALRNPAIPEVARKLREDGHTVFDDWFAAGPDADLSWRDYEIQRGHSFTKALEGAHAETVFDFDRSWLDWCEAGVLVLPAGKSAHLELGYIIGSGKEGFILLDQEPDEFDVMYRFATVVNNVNELRAELREWHHLQRS